MTPEQREESTLTPCPFCNGAMELFGPAQHNHPRNDCWLSSVKILAHEYESWNWRVQVEALTVPQDAIREAQANAVLGFAEAMVEVGIADSRIRMMAATTAARIRIPSTIPAIPGTKEAA